MLIIHEEDICNMKYGKIHFMTSILSKEFMKMRMKSKECEKNTIKGPLDT